MNEKEIEEEEEEEDDDEFDMVFSPDEDLLLYINEVSDLKELVEDQSKTISQLQEEISLIKKRFK